MNKEELIKKITEKKEFSQLPKKDVEMAFNKFDKPSYLDEEKIKLTRDLLRKVFSVFTSGKLLNIKDKEPEWILRKHISTRERFDYYPELYLRLLKEFNKENINIFDLGAGINGFSYNFFPKKTSYLGIEGMNQLVELMNYYFKKRDLKGAAIHESLFEIEKVKGFIKQVKGKRIIFLFKVIDSLEMIKGDYSKTLLRELTPLVDKVVLSFATRSLIKRQKFKTNRNWIKEFIKDNFEILDEFELGTEKYLVFRSK